MQKSWSLHAYIYFMSQRVKVVVSSCFSHSLFSLQGNLNSQQTHTFYGSTQFVYAYGKVTHNFSKCH